MTFDKMTVCDTDVACKRVLIRADFDVPIKDGTVTDTSKICAAVSTIQCVVEAGAKYIVLASHLGKPNGQQDCNLSLRPVADILKEQLEKEVTFLPDCVGVEVEAALCKATKGQIFLLENLRFHVEEEGKGCDKCGHSIVAKKEDVECFQSQLKKLADIYVNDAFSASGHPDASILACGFEIKAAGCVLQTEIEMLSKLLCPEKPFVVIIGGKLLAEKVVFIEKMIGLADELIVTGGPSLTILKEAQCVDIGCSEFDEEGAKAVKCLMDKAAESNVAITLPDDFIIGNEISDSATVCEATVADGIPEGFLGLDVGVKSRKKFKCSLEKAKTILWTGPPGMFELEKFSCGSRCMMKTVAEATKRGAYTAVIGRVTAEIPVTMKMEEDVSFLSTAGETAFMFLAGEPLPGIEALSPKPSEC